MTKLRYIAILLLFIGCNSTEDEAELEVEVQQEDELYFYAQVENASQYSDIVSVIFAVPHPTNPCGVDYVRIDGEWELIPCNNNIELARGDWKDGGFSIELPKTIETDYLAPLSVPSIMSISNENVKFRDAGLIGIDKDGFSVGAVFSLVKKLGEENYTRAVFRYVDSDVTISGYQKWVYSNNVEQTMTYSVEWKKGWNVWYFSRNISRIDGKIATVNDQCSSTPISGLKWYGDNTNAWPY